MNEVSINIRGQKINHFDIIASLSRESFYDYVRCFWHTIIPEEPVWNWHIEFLCDEIQKVSELVFANKPKEYDLWANVPPGSTKSTLFSVMHTGWTWTRMPTAYHINGSFAHLLSLDLSRKGRDVVTSDLYRRCFPEIQLRPDQATKTQWLNTKGGGYIATTVGSVIVGLHAHFLKIDDALDPQGARSEADIENANNWCTETLPQRKKSSTVSVLMGVMQRLHQNDPTGYQLERNKKSIRHICLPAVKTKHVKPRWCRAKYVDGLLDPVRLPKTVLEEKRAAIGEFAYAGQYLQNPVPLGGGMFNVDMVQFKMKPHWREFVEITRFWDKAGTQGGGAYTVGFCMGYTYAADDPKLKQFWFLDVQREQLAAGPREELIKSAVDTDYGRFKQWCTRRDGGRRLRYSVGVEQEPGSGGKDSAHATIAMLSGYTCYIDNPGSEGSKEERADTWATQVNIGNCFVPVDENGHPPPWWHELKQEMMYFPNSTYKDQIDGGSGAFRRLTSRKRRVGAVRSNKRRRR